MPGHAWAATSAPDFASLHPGYGLRQKRRPAARLLARSLDLDCVRWAKRIDLGRRQVDFVNRSFWVTLLRELPVFFPTGAPGFTGSFFQQALSRTALARASVALPICADSQGKGVKFSRARKRVLSLDRAHARQKKYRYRGSQLNIGHPTTNTTTNRRESGILLGKCRPHNASFERSKESIAAVLLAHRNAARETLTHIAQGGKRAFQCAATAAGAAMTVAGMTATGRAAAAPESKPRRVIESWLVLAMDASVTWVRAGPVLRALGRLVITSARKTMKSISSAKKSRGRGRPRVDATPVNTRFPPAELRALDAWIASRPAPKPSRPEAVRRLVEQALAHSEQKARKR